MATKLSTDELLEVIGNLTLLEAAELKKADLLRKKTSAILAARRK